MEIITVTLSPKTLAAKNCFMEKYKPKIPRRLIGSALGQHSEHVYVIEAYLKEVYKIKVPESFSKTILSAQFKNFPSCNFNISFKIVDEILFKINATLNGEMPRPVDGHSIIFA